MSSEKALVVRDELSKPVNKKRIIEMLPAVYRSEVDRFVSRAALTFATSKNRDKLLRCTPASIVQCVCQAAEYGFALDDKFVYAIPYGSVCTMTFDYKALVAVARRHGLILDARAQDVRENDYYKAWDEDFKQHYKFEKANSDRGAIVGAYCILAFPNGGHRFEHMGQDELKKVRESSKSPNSPAWVNWEGPMCKKAVIKRALGTVQDDPTLSSMIDRDNQEFDLNKIVDSSPVKTLDNITKEIFEDQSPAIENHSSHGGMTEAEIKAAMELEKQEAAEYQNR